MAPCFRTGCFNLQRGSLVLRRGLRMGSRGGGQGTLAVAVAEPRVRGWFVTRPEKKTIRWGPWGARHYVPSARRSRPWRSDGGGWGAADPNPGAQAGNDGRPRACQGPLPIANNKAGPWL